MDSGKKGFGLKQKECMFCKKIVLLSNFSVHNATCGKSHGTNKTKAKNETDMKDPKVTGHQQAG